MKITGRIKELIITAGGENVSPVLIEDAVKGAMVAISNCMVIGDRQKYLTMLITLKSEVDKETGWPAPPPLPPTYHPPSSGAAPSPSHSPSPSCRLAPTYPHLLSPNLM